MLVLQLFLSSPKPVLKFAATRTLAALALSHPTSVATCNVDLESLIADSNRSVATYAITTLLKVSLRLSVECLLYIQVFLDRKRGICGPPHQTNHWFYD
jgi:coatomer protein complex subunit gamma